MPKAEKKNWAPLNRPIFNHNVAWDSYYHPEYTKDVLWGILKFTSSFQRPSRMFEKDTINPVAYKGLIQSKLVSLS